MASISETPRSYNPLTIENATTIFKLGVNPMICWVVFRFLFNESVASGLTAQMFVQNVYNYASPGVHDKLFEKFNFPLFFHSENYKKKLKIMKEINELDDSLKNAKIKKYLELGKDAIEPMFNCLSPEYRKLLELAKYYEIDIVDFANIWQQEPNFDNFTADKRDTLFRNLLKPAILSDYCTKG